MEELETRDKLIKATMELLAAANRPEKITARKIAEEAGVNLAMINYCFKSKDQLVDEAVTRLLTPYSDKLSELAQRPGEPKERLFQVLNYLCEFTLKFEKYLALTIPYKLLQKQFAVPGEVLIIIEDFYQQRIPHQFSRVIALQLTTFTELLLLRSDEFQTYTGIDLKNQRQREHYLRFQIELLLQLKVEE